MDYWHKIWACPFFIWDDVRRVNCEGGCVLIFPDKETSSEFMDTYCASVDGYKKCSVADALLRYYERMDKREEERKSKRNEKSK